MDSPLKDSQPKAFIKVEFVGILPTLFAHCQHCMEAMHQTGMQPYSEQFNEYPEDIKKQYFKIAEIAQKIKQEFNGIVLFDVIDTASPQGLWMSIRHRIVKTPCVLIGGKKAFDRIPTYDELREKLSATLAEMRRERE
jgi:hypothetical protein